MKLAIYFGALLASVLSSGVAAAQDADTAKLAEARAIVSAVMPPESREQTVAQVIDQLSSQVTASMDLEKAGDPGLVALFAAYRKNLIATVMPTVRMNLPKIAEAMAIAYTHEFNLSELKDIHAFADTPSGVHYLSRSAAILGDPTVAAVNTAYLRELQQVVAPHAAEFKAKVVAYFTAHPAVAKKVVALSKGG